MYNIDTDYSLHIVSELIMKGGVCTVEITDVRIRRIDDEGKMKAVASITFDSEFVIHDIKIVSGKNGMFVAMPSKKIGQTYKDVAHPLTPETRQKISDAIFSRYEEALAERESTSESPRQDELQTKENEETEYAVCAGGGEETAEPEDAAVAAAAIGPSVEV